MSTVNGISPQEDSGDAENPANGAVLAIADNEFASAIQLLAYGWDIARPAQSSFNPNSFSFTALQTADSPFLAQAVASGDFIDQLTLVDYHDIDGDGTGEAVAKFTLKDVVFTSYGQASGEQDLPVDTFQVSFGELNVEYNPFDPKTGDFTETNSSTFDAVRRTSSTPEDFGGIDLGDPSPQAERILSFGEWGDIQVSAFTAPTFRVEASGSPGGTAKTDLTVDELVIETALNAASPDLIAALTSGTVLSDVVLSDYSAIAGKPELLSQWELTQAIVTSYEIVSDETAEALPTVRFTLAPQTELTQTVSVSSDKDGSFDSSNQVSVNLNKLDVDSGETALRALVPPAQPVNGAVLAIAAGELTREVQLLAYDWDIVRTGQSQFTPGQFSFAALQTADSPLLTEAVVSGKFVDRLTLIDYRDVDGDGTGEAIAQFVLEEVVFTDYVQSSGEKDTPIDTFQVSFGRLQVGTSEFDPQARDFIDFVDNTPFIPEDFGGTHFVDPSPQADRILSFGELGDIQVSAFTAPHFKVDTGSSRGSGAGAGLVTVDELVIETALNEATPDLIAALTSGTVLSDVVLSDYVAIAGKPELLSQWDLTQAVVTSYAIVSNETTPATPIVRFTLDPQAELTQTVNFDSDKNGSLDSSNQVSVNLDKLDGDFLGTRLRAKPLPTNPVNGAVLAITEDKSVSEIQLLSYGWEITRPERSQFNPGEFSFAALQTADSPFLTQAVLNGTLIDQLTLVDYRDVDGDGTGEAVAQFTLNDVVFTNYGQSSGANGLPVDTFQVSFGQLEVEYDQFDSQTGDFIGTNSSNFDGVRRTSSKPEDFGGTDLGDPSPQAERILSFGDLGDIRVSAFTAPTLRVDTNGSPGGGAGSGLATVDELVIETALNEATPDLIAALTSGTVLSDVVLSDYVAIAGQPELVSQWQLTQAVVTSYAIASNEDATDATAQSAPIVRFSLAPQAKLTQTVNFDSDQDGSLDSSNSVLLDVTSGTVTSSSVDVGSSQLASIPQDSLTGTSGDSGQVGEGEDWTDTSSKWSPSFDSAGADTRAMQSRALNSLDDVGPVIEQTLTIDDSSRFQGRGDSSANTFSLFGDELMGAIAPVTDVSIAAFNNSIPFG